MKVKIDLLIINVSFTWGVIYRPQTHIHNPVQRACENRRSDLSSELCLLLFYYVCFVTFTVCIFVQLCACLSVGCFEYAIEGGPGPQWLHGASRSDWLKPNPSLQTSRVLPLPLRQNGVLRVSVLVPMLLLSVPILVCFIPHQTDETKMSFWLDGCDINVLCCVVAPHHCLLVIHRRLPPVGLFLSRGPSVPSATTTAMSWQSTPPSTRPRMTWKPSNRWSLPWSVPSSRSPIGWTGATVTVSAPWRRSARPSPAPSRIRTQGTRTKGTRTQGTSTGKSPQTRRRKTQTDTGTTLVSINGGPESGSLEGVLRVTSIQR